MDVPVNVPVDNPNEDTEWNEILRKHGIIPEKPPSPTPAIQEALREARERAYENRLEDKQLDELDELEDEEDEEFLNQYRQQRLQELSSISKASVFGQVYHLQKPDYARDVTEASHSAWVLVHLSSAMSNHGESRLLTEIWRELAQRYPDVKFCEMQGNLCIEGYPEKNCPTILVYRDGEIVRQLLTLRELNGSQTTLADLERFLVSIGAVKLSDSRVRHLQREEQDRRASSGKQGGDDEGDDWD
ncbi:MAG: 37S ribosomal protein S22 [Watsoniomyces obsoletus]|nr:MAG: 37S ribosomal protein S22 [Watsoniomyces obsoletus]